MFEQCNKVLNIWQAQDKEFVFTLIKLIAIEIVVTIVNEQMFG
jgi:hypothetical protein